MTESDTAYTHRMDSEGKSMELCLKTNELTDASGQRVHLRPQALKVLCALARHSNSTVSKEQLLDHVWEGKVVTEDSLPQCITAIRQTLSDDAHDLIKTVYKSGYRLKHPHEKLTIVNGTMDNGLTDIFDSTVSLPVKAQFTCAHDGITLAYAQNGNGAPLLRAPTWMTHAAYEWNDRVFGPRYRKLAEELTLFRYDGRGFGLSDRTKGCGTLEDWLKDMDSVVEAIGLENLALAGNSGGAAISLAYASKYHDKVGCLVIMGGFMKGAIKRGVDPTHVREFSNLIEHGWAGKNAAFRQMMSTQLFPGATTEQMNGFDELQRKSTDGKTAADLITKLANTDVSKCLPKIQAPTLILHSEHDERQPFEQAVKMAKLIPNAELHVLDSVNHSPLEHEPAFESSVRLTIDFVKQHCS